MREQPYETFEHKGFTIKIYPDDSAEIPQEDPLGCGIFLVGFHRRFAVNVKGFDIETCRAIASNGYKHPTYHVFPLEAYIHSGVVLALSREGNFPDRQWDVSQLGLVFIDKQSFRMRKSAEKCARSFIGTWNQYLSGDVWGYVVKGQKNPEVGDSCWGFYGIEECRTEAKNIAEWHYDQERKAHIAKKKGEIKHHSPLESRSSFAV